MTKIDPYVIAVGQPSLPIGEVIGLAGQSAQFPAFLLDDQSDVTGLWPDSINTHSPQHQHANQLVQKHAIQLTKTSVTVAGTVSRRFDPEVTELEDDSIPRPVISGALTRGTNSVDTNTTGAGLKLTPGVFRSTDVSTSGTRWYDAIDASLVPVTSQHGGNECGLQHDALSSFWDGQQPTSAEFQTAAIRRNLAACLGEAATKGDGSAPSPDTETRLSVLEDTLCATAAAMSILQHVGSQQCTATRSRFIHPTR